MNDDSDWVEYRALVLSELKRLDEHIGKCDENMRTEVANAKEELAEKISKSFKETDALEKEITKLKTKVYVYGALAAMVFPELMDLARS